MTQLKSIDLFAGCWWLTEGFKLAWWFKTISLIEWEKRPCETIKKRLKTKWWYKNVDDIVLRFDIQRTKELIEWWSDEEYWESKWLKALIWDENVDLIIWWPPCQAYSLAGRIRDTNNMKDDYRNYLFRNYLDIVNRLQPKIFIFENVPGLLSATPDGQYIIDEITRECKAIGYEIYSKIKENWTFNASDYWVPQNRKRVIILWVRKSALRKHNAQDALEDFYSNIMTKYKITTPLTVKDAISDLPKLFPLNSNIKKQSHEIDKSNKVEYYNHIPRFHSQRDIEIFRELAEDSNKWKIKYGSSDALIQLYYEKTGKRTNVHKYHVLDRNKPSNTIPAHLYKDWLRHIHPDSKQARSITVREAARLQSFPDDFEFCGSIWEQYKMIGNAVPPLLAKTVALAVKDFIHKYL